MTIIHFRLDQRLIHGQVALAWSKMTNPNHIIVANDAAAHDAMKSALLKMAAPKQVRVSIQEVSKVINYLNKGTKENERIFLLVDKIGDVRTIIEGGVEISELNVGNMTYKEGSKKYTSKIFINDEEEESLKMIMDHGVYCYYQVLPTDEKVNFSEII